MNSQAMGFAHAVFKGAFSSVNDTQKRSVSAASDLLFQLFCGI